MEEILSVLNGREEYVRNELKVCIKSVFLRVN